MAFSALVGVVDFTAVLNPVEAIRRFREGAFYCSGPQCWVFERPQALIEPIPCSGRQGLWNVPEPIADQVSRALLQQDTGGHDLVPDSFLELWRLKR
jgi:hypothetical protein